MEAVFARAGFPVQARAELPLFGGPPLPLDWVVTVTLAAPIAAFFMALGAEAGKDSYRAFKDWLAALCAARRATGERGQITLAHGETALRMPTPIPDAGIDALREIDWSAETSAYLVWDEERGYLAWDTGREDWRPAAKHGDHSSA